MASLTEAYSTTIDSIPDSKISEAEAHDTGVAQELKRHARTMSKDHPDRNKFVLESARLSIGKRSDAEDTALKNLTESYEIPHDLIRARRQAHLENRARFQREVIDVV